MKNVITLKGSDLALRSPGGWRINWAQSFMSTASWAGAAGSPSSYPASSPKPHPDPTTQSSPPRPRLLLVEDDPVSAKSLQLLLAGQGFDVVIAGTLAEAVPLLFTSPTHALIDLMLPDGDGASILRTIRDKNLPIWVGVITGVSDPARLGLLNALQPKLLLQKPIDLPALFRALK